MSLEINYTYFAYCDQTVKEIQGWRVCSAFHSKMDFILPDEEVGMGQVLLEEIGSPY